MEIQINGSVKSHIAKIKNNLIKSYSETFYKDEKVLIESTAAAVATLMCLYGVISVKEYFEKRDISTISITTQNHTQNTKMFESAYNNDVEEFKYSLQNGAQITTPNQHNQNSLMVALSHESYDVVAHILATPKLRNNIDYKQIDDEGNSISDIMRTRIERESFHNGNKSKIVLKLKSLEKIINTQLQKQNQEEAKGRARSNTKYDAFALAMQNQENTGK